MGAGASAGLEALVTQSSEDELKGYVKEIPLSARQQVADALAAVKGDKPAGKTDEPKKEEAKDDEDEEEDDEQDDVEDAPPPPAAYMKKGPRTSVSAEAYGAWNQLKEFTPPVNPKSEEQKKKIVEIVGKSFLFSSLAAKELNIIADAMVEKQVEEKTRLIQEGDDGDVMYVIESGKFSCLKKISGEEKVVKECNAGDFFGELALLYNCPRAASVEAVEKALLWELDRQTFNHIVRDSAMKAPKEEYEGFTAPPAK